jgi:hypothetical protein
VEVRRWNNHWKKVESHIPTIMAIREEGRMWAQSASCVAYLKRISCWYSTNTSP